jgi:hypothetical protein
LQPLRYAFLLRLWAGPDSCPGVRWHAAHPVANCA